ncbi:Mth938-like domain-containing protein [Arenibaculum pallidiluteum]|uniref:Mth938-like domain-containing protein n=1 Tax=Arenibaculum pallidiluteum TaxID=2812559 RepID=UPI001A95C733|nr:Mth938-like domain-containing protein [Arenibaculum pallidiluteum]
MDVTPLIPAGRQIIEDYGPGGFRVSGVVFGGPVLVLPERSLDWDVASFGELTERSFDPVTMAEPRPELLLLGSGPRIQLLPSRLRQAIRAHGVVIEVMDTGAACRTYNVLLGEGRRVGAALLPG